MYEKHIEALELGQTIGRGMPEAVRAAIELMRAAETRSFDEAWADMQKHGYQYGEDALEQVRFGWVLACARLDGELIALRRAIEPKDLAAERARLNALVCQWLTDNDPRNGGLVGLFERERAAVRAECAAVLAECMENWRLEQVACARLEAKLTALRDGLSPNDESAEREACDDLCDDVVDILLLDSNRVTDEQGAAVAGKFWDARVEARSEGYVQRGSDENKMLEQAHRELASALQENERLKRDSRVDALHRVELHKRLSASELRVTDLEIAIGQSAAKLDALREAAEEICPIGMRRAIEASR